MYSTIHKKDFRLESGVTIENLTVGFHTYGTLNEAKDNVIWICHALTANSDVLDWWEGLFGSGKLFDPDRYFIVCANTLGSCYGTTGPLTPLGNKRPLLDKFPEVTTRDMAGICELLSEHLGIKSIYALIGASLGGQQALEWSILYPEKFKNLFLIATNAYHSPYGIAFNESQRLAIQTDPTFGNGNINGGRKGLIAARSIALLSYRSYAIYGNTQKEESTEKVDGFKASGYQRYQGEKLANRFNAYSYMTLSKAMDSHNVARGRGESVTEILKKVKAKTLVIGVTSDQLFPISEQKFLATEIPNAEYAQITSDYGHDGFLIETKKIAELINDFLFNEFRNNKPTVFKTTIKKNQLMNLYRS